MLFQMCYGPEIKSIYESIREEPYQTIFQLRDKFQYQSEGDIKSLIDGVITFLKDVDFIVQEKDILKVIQSEWSNIELLRNLRYISQTEKDTLNYVFASMYDQLFVKPDRLFFTNMHYHINNRYERNMIGHEKVNAWKRMMECFGLGRRVYSEFYALPHLSLLKELISKNNSWEGPLHEYCEKLIDPIIPCLTAEGNIYKGLLFGLFFLNENKNIELSHKQDLPFKSYGPMQNWNWICT